MQLLPRALLNSTASSLPPFISLTTKQDYIALAKSGWICPPTSLHFDGGATPLQVGVEVFPVNTSTSLHEPFFSVLQNFTTGGSLEWIPSEIKEHYYARAVVEDAQGALAYSLSREIRFGTADDGCYNEYWDGVLGKVLVVLMGLFWFLLAILLLILLGAWFMAWWSPQAGQKRMPKTVSHAEETLPGYVDHPEDLEMGEAGKEKKHEQKEGQ